MSPMTFTGSAWGGSPSFPGGGLSTHRITKNPIISMTRSAKVKIHSGHSSHSVGLHLQAAFLAMLELVGSRQWAVGSKNCLHCRLPTADCRLLFLMRLSPP